jgi:hypothetical protein
MVNTNFLWIFKISFQWNDNKFISLFPTLKICLYQMYFILFLLKNIFERIDSILSLFIFSLLTLKAFKTKSKICNDKTNKKGNLPALLNVYNICIFMWYKNGYYIISCRNIWCSKPDWKSVRISEKSLIPLKT